MVLRHTIVEPKLIEEARLITDLPTHHRGTLLIFFDQQESSFRDPLNSFFDSIDPKMG
jgi:peptide methionine sulfoxide reductase MsrA